MSVDLLNQRREKRDRGQSLESRISALENYITMLVGSGDIASGAVKNLHIGESLVVGNTDADITVDNPQNVAWLTDAGAMAYENMVEKAMLGTTIIVGGYVKTGLVNADNIITGTLLVAHTEADVTGDHQGDINGSNIVNGEGWTDDTAAIAAQADATQAISDAATAQGTADGKVTTFYQTTAPTAEGIGDLWVDTDDKNKLYRWDGTNWVIVRDTDIAQAIADAASAQTTADGKIVSFYQDEPPTADGVGDFWIDTNDDNKLYRWSGTAWVSVRDAGIAIAIADAATAQATADGKIITFYQDGEPTAGESSVGDLWVDTNDGNKLYRYSGSAWTEVQDSDIATALADAANAQSTADGKIISFFQTTAPTADGVGDLWFDTDDNNKPYRWNGTAWVNISNPTDWLDVGDPGGNKPFNGADVTADSNFVTVTYPADQSDIQDQIDGKIVSWFTDTDPQPTWSGTDASHAGDMWWNTSTKKLKRYTGSAWSSDIEDQKAIDAYNNASTAQDTADGKRRVFTAEPTTPYDVGDLWAAGPSGDLKKCKTAKGAAGVYAAGDWELASNADNTAANTQDYSWITGTKPPTDADATQAALNLGAAIDYAKANGVTLIDDGYFATGLVNASFINAGTLSVAYSEADVTGDNTADDVSYIGSHTGWQITAGKIKSYNGTIELKGSDTPHIKALYDANNYVQMTGQGNVPRFDVYGGGYLRTRLDKNALSFYGTNGTWIGDIYGQSAAGPGLYIECDNKLTGADQISNPLYVVAPELDLDGDTILFNFGSGASWNSIKGDGTDVIFDGGTSANLLPYGDATNGTLDCDLGSTTRNWKDLYISGDIWMDSDNKLYFGSSYIGYTNSMLYLGKSTHLYGYLRLHQYASNPATETGSIWAFSSGGTDQFRGEPSTDWFGSFDMTAL